MSESRKLVITGGGFAGIGCALQARRCNNDLDITLLEKRPQILPWIDRKGLMAYPLGTTLVSSPNEETSIQTWSAVSSLLQKWDPKILLDLLDGRHAGRSTEGRRVGPALVRLEQSESFFQVEHCGIVNS